MSSAVTIAWLLLAPAEVPPLAVGPELKEEAPFLDARIDEVTVYSDRARIRRRARAEAKAGVSGYRLPDLPGGVLLETVRVYAGGARVIRVEASPVEREVVSIDQVKGLLDLLEKVTDRMAELEHQLAIERRELERIGSVHPAAPVEEKDRDGRRALPIAADAWFESLDFLGGRDLAARARLRKAEAELHDLVEKRDDLARQIEEKNLGAFTDRRVEVFVALESASAKKVEVELEYFMTGARWKPGYDLRFDGNGKLTVETGAMVQQATGEDWTNVSLSLSTAIPGQGIDLPELLTWTLGESRDFTPQARPARASAVPPLFAPPAPLPTRAEERRRIEIEVLQLRFAQAMGRATLNLDQDVEITGRLAKPAAVQPPRPAPPPEYAKVETAAKDYAPAPTAGASAYDEGEVTIAERSSGRSRSISYVRTPLALFEAPQQQLTFSDPYLPAVSAGGLDYVYEAPARVTISSIAEDRRIPLAAQTFSAETFYEATPSLDTTAFVKAKVKNGTGRPLLRGPTNIFVGGELVGQGEIQTTGPGGEIGFALGADENIRILRTVVPTTERKGVFSKDDVTTYAVKIQIGNYKRSPITIEVIDQIPKSSHEDVEVKLVSAAPPALKEPDADGVLRWRISIPPKQTKTISLSYTIGRPADWQLYQQ
jgi:hypothetical protein